MWWEIESPTLFIIIVEKGHINKRPWTAASFNSTYPHRGRFSVLLFFELWRGLVL